MSASQLFNSVETDYIEIGDVLDFDGETAFSVSVWVYKTGGDSNFVAKQGNATSPGEGWNIFSNNASSLNMGFQIRNNSSNRISTRETPSSGSLSQWAHMCVTYDGSTNNSGVTLYRDGVSRAHTAFADTLDAGEDCNTTEPLRFAKRYDSNFMWDGNIAEVRVYDRELSNAEVVELYSGKINTVLNGLVGYWPIIGPAGIFELDRSGAGNDGTNFGTSSSVLGPPIFAS